ncbi:mono-functional DNA-alkylating methyl methanesulfonate N-term-domain-containing protein [Polychytrium aggregatum]|uniref:mono-functional DNA-alkylating methyl methanesulfonate N-term-domain-containing protein n=1 Tax=Polychytrium aggregatum TaxID=110093 RepID=UPI0022FDDB64|nr:mono-functional DNA-alkylating methyl methanesulfonate N-term-domain-containing protein [Polychytrium aggregatum]KAI9205725.1 mono-functional DNA-alkylating methyl methanesulfonate N-term-domain-containing protein [Polychytrium aggregatum]
MTLSSQPLVYASVPLRLGPIAKVLPLSPTHILPTCPMVVLAKESQLQLALIDLQKGTSVLLASQYIFGSIKDIQICHRQTHGSPGVVTSADPGCKLGPVCPATHPTDVLHPERAFYSTVLVATSDSGQLSFIGIAHLEQSQYRFVPLHHYSIASPNANYMELGHLVCADPFFRSVAVTSVQNSFDVLVFSPQLYQGSSFWNEAQHLKIDEPGVILHASFLSPPSENDRILLVLSLCRSQRFYIVVYEYWQVEPRNTMRRIAEIPHTSTSNESCTPLHLLSLPDIPCGFALITETELVVYRILGGSSKSARVMGVARISIADKLDLNPPIIESNYCVSAAVASFCTTRSQAVVASDGPLEQSIYATISAPISNESHLYHIRCVIKDRVAPLVEFGHRLQVPSVKAISPVLGVAPDGHGHYLMLVGDMRNSSVIYTSPTTTYEVQTVYDWSPITDFGLADLHKEGRDSVFLSSGINSNGAVFAARNGIELITEYSTSMLNGMIDMWNLKSDPRQPKDDVLVVSSISATRVLHLNESELVDISAFLGFELEKRTVLASHTETPGVFVQAHTDGVVVSKSALPGDSWSGTGEAEVWDTASVGGGTIVQAAIFDDLLIVVTRNGQTYHKTLLKIMADSGDGPPSIIDMVHEPLECEPSCLITLPTLSNELRRTYLPANIVIMGTHAPGLELMYLDGYGDYRRLECFHRERLASAALGYETPNSIAFLANGQKAYLLVSNRAGQFYAYPWTLVEGRRVVLQQPVCHKIGHRAITFKTRMRWSHSAPFESEAASCDFVLAATDRVWKIGLSSEGDVYVKLLSCDPVRRKNCRQYMFCAPNGSTVPAGHRASESVGGGDGSIGL